MGAETRMTLKTDPDPIYLLKVLSDPNGTYLFLIPDPTYYTTYYLLLISLFFVSLINTYIEYLN